jgi:serine/threonine-protein kinase
LQLEHLAGGKEWWTTTETALRDVAQQSEADPPKPSYKPATDHVAENSWLNKISVNGFLGPYRLETVIGHGGTGVVAMAFDTQLQRRVAIKVLFPHLASNGAAKQRFAREAQAAATVVHPSVVPIHAVDAQHDPPYLIMAYVPGGSLQQRLDSQGGLDVVEILRIALQVCEGLAAAHSQGLVHRDVKPANILLEAGTDRVLLSDFGLARALDDATLTASGYVAGTPPYMSPEQARGDNVDQRSDLFSVGSLMYAMATGRAPFQGNSPLTVLQRVCNQPTPSVRTGNEALPAWLDRLVALCHAKQPKDRIADAQQLAEILRQCLAHVQRPSVFPLPSCLRTRSYKPAIVAACCLLVGILLGLVPAMLTSTAGDNSVSNKGQSEATIHTVLVAPEPQELWQVEQEAARIQQQLFQLESSIESDW